MFLMCCLAGENYKEYAALSFVRKLFSFAIVLNEMILSVLMDEMI